MFKKDFREAINTFEKLEIVHRVIDPHLRIDAAHAYFVVGDTSKARFNYEFSKDLADPIQSSEARNQLGILALMRGDSTEAIQLFRSAIERNALSDAARYNYELISTLYKPRSLTPQSQTSDAPQTVVASDNQEDELQKEDEGAISRERALQLLDNLRMSEMKTVRPKNSKIEIEKDW